MDMRFCGTLFNAEQMGNPVRTRLYMEDEARSLHAYKKRKQEDVLGKWNIRFSLSVHSFLFFYKLSCTNKRIPSLEGTEMGGAWTKETIVKRCR